MTKTLHALGIFLGLAVGLAACDLYFGGNNGGGGGNGYSCSNNSQCAAGCYCSNGTCTEGGFCSTDADCGPGYHCDTMRSSCVPNNPPATCGQDSQCPQGQYCTGGQCVGSCTCTSDAQAVAGGFGWCDVARMTCMPGPNPNGTCGGDFASTCMTATPSCPTGSVPELVNGCWNGSCQVYAQCDVAPVCGHINDEADCLGRGDCSTVYDGINCTKADGSACHAGDTGCTCQSYSFASCAAKM